MKAVLKRGVPRSCHATWQWYRSTRRCRSWLATALEVQVSNRHQRWGRSEGIGCRQESSRVLEGIHADAQRDTPQKAVQGKMQGWKYRLCTFQLERFGQVNCTAATAGGVLHGQQALAVDLRVCGR
jgi:hypothetical protein